MECMLTSRYTAEHIKIFLKDTEILVLGMCMGERREELKGAESCSGIQCMGVRVLDFSPPFSLLRSLFLLPFSSYPNFVLIHSIFPQFIFI